MISAIIGPRVNGVMYNRYYTEKDVINCIFHRCRKSIRAFHACRFKEEMTSLFYTSRVHAKVGGREYMSRVESTFEGKVEGLEMSLKMRPPPPKK